MKNYLKCIYSIWSKLYDKILNRIFFFDRSKVIKALSPKKGERILEVGVGTGLNLQHYPAGISVTGIDFSKAMLAQASKKVKGSKAKIKLETQDAAKLRFKPNSFDKAFTTYVLRVSPAPKKVLLEAARVTKPGAMFVILDQFKEKGTSRIISAILAPFKLLLGWGRDLDLAELIRGTDWKIHSRKQFGKMKGTKIVVLKNTKKKK